MRRGRDFHPNISDVARFEPGKPVKATMFQIVAIPAYATTA